MPGKQLKLEISNLEEQLELLRRLYDDMIRDGRKFDDVKPIHMQIRELETTIKAYLDQSE